MLFEPSPSPNRRMHSHPPLRALLLLTLVAAGCASHAPGHALQGGRHVDPASRPLQPRADEICISRGALMDVLAVAKCAAESPPQAPKMQPVLAATEPDGNKKNATTTQVDEICAIILAEIPDINARLAHAAPGRQAVDPGASSSAGDTLNSHQPAAAPARGIHGDAAAAYELVGDGLHQHLRNGVIHDVPPQDTPHSESGRGAQVEPPRQADVLDEEQLPLQQQTELQQDRLEADPQTSAPKTGRLADLQAELETKKWPTGENDKAINDRNKTIATIPRGGVDASLPAEIFAGIGHGGHHTMPTSALAAAEEAMLFKGVASEAIIKLLLTANRERRRRVEEIFDAALQTKDDGDAATQVEARRRESAKRQREIFRESRTIQRLVGEKQVLDHIRAMRCPGAAPAVRSSDVNNDDDDIKNDKNDDNNGDDNDDIIDDKDNDHDNGESVQAYYDVGKRASCSVLTAEIAKLAAMSGKGRRRLAACPTFLEASHADLQGRSGGLEDGVNYVEVSCDMDASSESSLTVGSGQTYKIAKHPNAAGEVKLDRKATRENRGRHFEVTTGGSLTVSGLTLTGGYAVSDACNVCARFCSIHGSWRSMIHFMSLFCFPIT